MMRCIAALLFTFTAAMAQEAPDQTQCQAVSDDLERARTLSFVGDYQAEGAALDRLRVAYQTYAIDQCADPNIPSYAQILMMKGLSESNSRRYAQAEVMFNLAGREIERNPDAFSIDPAFLAVYQSWNRLNQGFTTDEVLDSEAITELLAQLRRTVQTSAAASTVGEEGASKALVESLPAYTEASILYARGCSDATEEGCEGDRSAVEAIDEAITIISPFDRLSQTVLPRYKMLEAQIYLDLDQYRGALTNIDQTIARWSAAGLGAMRQSSFLAFAHFLRGRTLIEMANVDGDDELMDEAFAAFESGFEILESTPGAMDFDRIWPFLAAVEDRLAQTTDPKERERLENEMFRAVQFVRSTDAVAAIARSMAAFRARQSEDPKTQRALTAWTEARLEQQRLASELAFLERTVGPENVEATIKREQLNRAKSDLDRAQENFENVTGGDFSKATQQPVDLDTLKDVLVTQLDGNPAFLFTAVGTSGTGYVFLIDREGSRLRTFADEGVADMIAQLRRDVSPGRSPGTHRIFRTFIAYELYDRVFSGFDEDGRRPADYDVVYAASTGAFEKLPLSLLISEDPDTPASGSPMTENLKSIAFDEDYTVVRWLGDDVAFTYLPSVRNFVDAVSTEPAEATESRAFLGGGFVRDETFEQNLRANLPAHSSCGQFVDAVMKLKDLPDTREHLRQIQSSIGPSTVLVDETFTASALKSLTDRGELKQYGLIHLYTHGFLPPANACVTEPFIVMTAAENDATLVPGFMTTLDIERLELNAQLVFVSACNSAGAKATGTASAQDRDADSLSGLSRAFIKAGARALIVAHWTVYEEETRMLVNNFYNIAASEPKSIGVALNEAAKELRSDPRLSHPIYWAGFVAVGAGQQILSLPSQTTASRETQTEEG